jgi:hypothetical protein
LNRRSPLLRRVDRHELAISTCIAIGVAVTAVAWPLSMATYPPMTDLPMHAAHTSALHNFWDPSFHFADQFELQPIAVPYLSTYVVGAVLMEFFSVSAAVRIATGMALLLLPAGIAVLTWGMRKSPLLGLAAVPLCWGHLVHWGFINFVAALGLCAMSIGLALRLVDRPSRRVAVGLASCLTGLFFTHVFRFPFAILAVGVAAPLGAYALEAAGANRGWRAARRCRLIILAAAPSLVLFGWFLAVRPAGIAVPIESVVAAPHLERLSVATLAIVNGFHDPAELDAARLALAVTLAVAVWSVAIRAGRRDRSEPDPRGRAFTRAATAVVAGLCALCALLFLSLPFKLGSWWYVFPREATAACFFAIALLPDLPRLAPCRVLATAAFATAALITAKVPASHYARFDEATEDFRAIVARIPKAPKLLYLVIDHVGTSRTTSPYLHFPAWVQAEKGGWLVFHFALHGSSPLRIRTDPDAVVAPRVPLNFDWHPESFDLDDHRDFFDWFLLRAAQDPSERLASDLAIEQVAHQGMWWLYRKRR